MEAARQCSEDRKEWRALMHVLMIKFHRTVLLSSSVFRTALPRSGAYHLDRGGMQLHDAVLVHCRKGHVGVI